MLKWTTRLHVDWTGQSSILNLLPLVDESVTFIHTVGMHEFYRTLVQNKNKAIT